MPALPEPLGGFLAVGSERLPKRERTRRQLLLAAIQVFSARGVAAASIQEIALVAGMTTGTVYNHFSTKEEIVKTVAIVLAETLCLQIDESYEQVTDGAERMAIGMRRYQWLAQESPEWALLMMGVSAATPELTEHIYGYSLADLRLGVRQKRFRITTEDAAMDMVFGACQQSIVKIASGQAKKPAQHSAAVVTMILVGLGLAYDEATEIVSRPLPPFPDPQAQAVPARRAARVAR